MSTLLSSAPPPPQREKQAPRTLGKVRDGGLLGVWNRPWSAVSSRPGLPCSRNHPQGHISMVTQPGLSNIPELSEMEKKKKYTHTQNWAFLLGQGSGIGILSFDSHPWKRLTPERACVCCCFKPKGETSNSPCCYGLPGAHCPLHRRCLLTQPLPASQWTHPQWHVVVLKPLHTICEVVL